MRLKHLAIGILGVAALASCKQVTKDQGKAAFLKELHLYFNNLNNEAQSRKDEFRKADVKLGMVLPTGSIYSTYTFDDQAFIVKNVTCKVCGTKLLITSAPTEYLCPSCGHCPYAPHPAGFDRKVAPCKICMGADGKPREPNASRIMKEAFPPSDLKPMFEFKDGKDDPKGTMLAYVRYVRRQWAFDPRGVVDLSPRVLERVTEGGAGDVLSYLPSDAPGGRSPGFHRLDGTFVGELVFAFRGGDLTLVARNQEEVVRPWKAFKVSSSGKHSAVLALSAESPVIVD